MRLILALISTFLWGVYTSENVSSEYVYYDFKAPDQLTKAEFQRDYQERKEIITNYLLDEQFFDVAAVPIYISNNRSFNQTILATVCPELKTDSNPDFDISIYVRIMFKTDNFTDELVSCISEVPLWFTKNESFRLYWTENHHILFTTSAYLLRQSFADRFPSDYFDENLDVRLDWILRTKQKHSLFEFYSPIYVKLTIRALINLYDFAEDPQIKEGARKVILKIFSDWMKIINTSGVVASSSGRTHQFFFYPEEKMFGLGTQQMIFLTTGLGPLRKFYHRIQGVSIFLIESDIDISEAILSYTSNTTTNTLQIGSFNIDIFEGLPKHERAMAQISMGSYSHYSYINDLYYLFKENDAMNHKILKSERGILEAATLPSIRSFGVGVMSSITSASMLVVDELVIFKSDEIRLSSCLNYFPGFKGYQQIPAVAIIKNSSVFTFSIKEEHFLNRKDGEDQTAHNNQMPYLAQQDNVQLAIYNPNSDLSILQIDNVDVLFHMKYEHYDTVIEQGNWVLGDLEGSFVAVFRQCFNESAGEDHVYTMCYDEKQAWFTVVGNDQTHGTFEAFQQQIFDSEVQVTKTNNCVYVLATVDGKLFDDFFCRNLGNVVLVIITVCVLILSVLCCCILYCCRKKLKTKEKEGTVRKISNVTL